MDPRVVVDASVWVSRFMQADVHYPLSRQWVDQYINSGGHIIEPALLLSEVAGAIARRSGQPVLAHHAINDLLSLAALDIVSLEQPLAVSAAQMAANFRLRGADAIYVALAQSLSIPLITWDGEQQQRTVGHIATYTPATYIF